MYRQKENIKLLFIYTNKENYMNKILVLSHGTISEGIKTALRVITSEEDAVDTMCIMEDTPPEKVRDDLRQYLDNCDADKPVFIVTDIPFGSTTTLSAPFIGENKNLYIISGMNLGMMMAMVTQDLNEDTENKIKQIIEECKQTIIYVNDFMK